MNIPNKKPPGARGTSAQFTKPVRQSLQFKPIVAQLKTPVFAQSSKSPVAPPVYRPQPTPKVLQTKRSAVQTQVARPLRTPVAPPVYRPQPVPKVLQAKSSSVALRPHSGQAQPQPASPRLIQPMPRKIFQPQVVQRSAFKDIPLDELKVARVPAGADAFDFGFDSPGENEGEEDKKPRVDRKLLVGQKFAKLVRQLTDQVIFLSGGAAVALMGGPREIDDLDFRIVCAFTFAEPEGVAFISRLNDQLLLKEKLWDDEPLNKAFVCQDRTGHTIMGEWDNCKISISRTPTVQYLGINKFKNESLKIRLIHTEDLIYDKALSICFRKSKEKELNDLVDLLHLLKGKAGGGGASHAQVVKDFATRRGTAYNLKMAEDWVDEEPIPKPMAFLKETINDLYRSNKKQVLRLVRNYGLEPDFHKFYAELQKY